MSVTPQKCPASKRKSPPTDAFDLDSPRAAGSSKRPRQSPSCSTTGRAAAAAIESSPPYRTSRTDEYDILCEDEKENSGLGTSEEDALAKRLGLQLGGGKTTDQEDDSEEDEWETEEEEEEDEDMLAGVTRETIVKSLGELFSSGFLQQMEHDCEPEDRGQGMERLRKIFVQPPPGNEEGNRTLNILEEEDWNDLEAIFRQAKTQEEGYVGSDKNPHRDWP